MSKNYPFYNWVPKPVGIILLILLFIPILTVGGVYTANSGEMTSGLGIQSEHIQFVGFVTSIEDDVRGGFLTLVHPQLCVCCHRQYLPSRIVQPYHGFPPYGAHDGESLYPDKIRFRNGSYKEYHSRNGTDHGRRLGCS